VRPFNKYLRWALENFPFGDDRWSATRLPLQLEAILASADLAEQQSLFRDAEQLARAHGLGSISTVGTPISPGYAENCAWRPEGRPCAV
jgi:hypothetical protein